MSLYLSVCIIVHGCLSVLYTYHNLNGVLLCYDCSVGEFTSKILCTELEPFNHFYLTVCSGNENTGHPPDARGNTSYDISTPVVQLDIPNNTVSGNTAHLLRVLIQVLV